LHLKPQVRRILPVKSDRALARDGLLRVWKFVHPGHCSLEEGGISFTAIGTVVLTMPGILRHIIAQAVSGRVALEVVAEFDNRDFPKAHSATARISVQTVVDTIRRT
jgi:hypothetical protein